MKRRNVLDVPRQFTTEDRFDMADPRGRKSQRNYKPIAHFKEADKVEIISLMDNSVDFLSPNRRKEVLEVRKWTRVCSGGAKEHFQYPLAEHGFSVFVRVIRNRRASSILFDTGSTPKGVIINAKRMGIEFKEIVCIVLSHGHYDHFGGLLAIIKAVKRENLPIIVHEDMFRTRGKAKPDGTIRKYPLFPTQNQVKPANYIKTTKPLTIADDLALVTGEIPRLNDFERGLLHHQAFVNGKWTPDPWIWDDRALILNVRGKGLVVISGCGHAGILNTVSWAQRITGVENVYAVIGGFHLADRESEQRVSRTIERLRVENPWLLVPSHCTGWRAKCAMASAMPDSFVWNSVGNLYRL